MYMDWYLLGLLLFLAVALYVIEDVILTRIRKDEEYL